MFHSLRVSSVTAELSLTFTVQAEEATGAEQFGAGRPQHQALPHSHDRGISSLQQHRAALQRVDVSF